MTQNNIINFPLKRTRNLLPFAGLFANPINEYKQHQDEIRRRKIEFLEKQAFDYFYTLYAVFWSDSAEIPQFLQEAQAKKYAQEQSKKAVLDVIAENRLNECYTKRVNELKKAARSINSTCIKRR